MKSDNEKLKDLADLVGKMKDEFVEKAKQGDEHALSRAGEMTLLKHWAEKVRNCVTILTSGKMAGVSAQNAVLRTQISCR